MNNMTEQEKREIRRIADSIARYVEYHDGEPCLVVSKLAIDDIVSAIESLDALIGILQ